jgi:RNA polymerase sigma factor (sigma-70 family)
LVNQPTKLLKIHVNCENDQSLFALLRQGDESAFAQIYKRYWPELYNAAYKRLPEKEKCQDIIQNVFTDLWNRKAELDLANPAAYLHTAVRFQVLKQISRAPKNSAFTAKFETELISPLATDSGVLEKEARVLIEYFINALPKKRKNIFVMHYFEGLSTAKIAVELKVSQKTVQNQLTTASHALKLRLTHMLIFLVLILSALAK